MIQLYVYYIYICTYIFFFRLFSIISYYKILNIVSCAIDPYSLSILYIIVCIC